MQETTFVIDGDPVPASRPKVSKFSTYYPPKHTAYVEYLRRVLSLTPEHQTTQPVAVKLLFVMPPYKTSDHPVPRQDVDNLMKLPIDCMTKTTVEGGVHKYWKDDDLLVTMQGFKRFAREGETPHTVIRITPIDGHYSDFVDAQFWS